MRRFSLQPRYRQTYLHTAADVVQYSFIIQNSISHLNLDLCQSYPIQYPARIPYDFPSLTFSGDIINTEEKCQKVLAKRRSLLYTLHLDLPRSSERSLKSDSKPLKWSSDVRLPQISKISLCPRFYFSILCNLVQYACNHTDQNIKVLKWFIKLDGYTFKWLSAGFIRYFVNCMHPGFSDSAFVIECFRKLSFNGWLRVNTKSEEVEKLLIQLNKAERKYDLNAWSFSFKEKCLVNCQHVGALLKIQNAPVFGDSLHVYLSRRVESLFVLR
ncbi:hypothetical protein AVEN_123184-1 [Araneus ventricosus]|uniref:Uncharacterized protein n=2 Tax=Araneus ventricosus TaxID=182803 RepID=A0A4Y2IY35_ARAVE|nr:hypothetical protein AVEN_123184-1 [Araneus ventricosus]